MASKSLQFTQAAPTEPDIDFGSEPEDDNCEEDIRIKGRQRSVGNEKKTAPDTTVYDADGNFYSFDWVLQVPRGKNEDYKCSTGAYNSPNHYEYAMRHCLNLEANSAEKTLREYSRILDGVHVTVDPPKYDCGTIAYKGKLPRCVTPYQKVQMMIVKETADGRLEETDAYCEAVLLNIPAPSATSTASSMVEEIKFRVKKLVGHVEATDRSDVFVGDDRVLPQTSDPYEESIIEYDEGDAIALAEFYRLVEQNPTFRANFVFIADDTATRRMNNALNVLKNLSSTESNTATWRDKVRLDESTRMPLSAVDDKTYQISEPIRDFLIRGKCRDSRVTFKSIFTNFDDPTDALRKLNQSQQKAVHLSESNFILLIQGPPGTGKTSTATSIIRCSLIKDGKVLITAPSNTAVDNILRALLQSTTSDNERAEIDKNIIRICSRGKYYKPAADIEKYSLTKQALKTKNLSDRRFCAPRWRLAIEKKFGPNAKSTLEKSEDRAADMAMHNYQKALLRDKFKLVFATCNGAADARLKNTFFKLVIIDEAAQDVEPCTLIAFTRLHVAGRVTLLGDPCQLGPCVSSTEAIEMGYETTLFERLHNMGAPFQMLTEQYRMHPHIGTLVSDLTYNSQVNNRVHSHERQVIPQLPRNYPTSISGYPIAWVHTTGGEMFNESVKSIENVTEANAVVDIAARLIGVYEIPVRNIVVISSYSAQVVRLRATIEEACKSIGERRYLENSSLKREQLQQALRSLRIGTVDGFQGQEADIVIYSVTRSNEYFNIGFLENQKRLNVAISRARCLLFIVGNATMFPPNVNARCFRYGRRHKKKAIKWRSVLEKCILNRAIFDSEGKQIQLPHDKEWPIVGQSQEDLEIIKLMLSSKQSMVVAIRDHLVTEFRMTTSKFLYDNWIRTYDCPNDTSITGWTEIVLTNVVQSRHDDIVKLIQQNIAPFHFHRMHTRRCYIKPCEMFRGGSLCKKWKGQIFKGPLQLPLDFESMHYRDPVLNNQNGVDVKETHRVLYHVHFRHDVFRLIVGAFRRAPYFIYETLHKQKIVLMTEDTDVAMDYEFVCGYLTTKKKYDPSQHWSLEAALNYVRHCITDMMGKWQNMDRNITAKRIADDLAERARRQGYLFPSTLFE